MCVCIYSFRWIPNYQNHAEINNATTTGVAAENSPAGHESYSSISVTKYHNQYHALGILYIFRHYLYLVFIYICEIVTFVRTYA